MTDIRDAFQQNPHIALAERVQGSGREPQSGAIGAAPDRLTSLASTEPSRPEWYIIATSLEGTTIRRGFSSAFAANLWAAGLEMQGWVASDPVCVIGEAA